MKHSFLFMSAILTCIVVWFSCNKDDPDSAPGNALNSLQEFYDNHAQSSQFFTINSQSDQTITGQQGTQVTFSEHVFLKPNGQIATGNVKIELKEIYKKSDMLYAGKPTVIPSGQPLKSGGEVFLKATLGSTGEELIIRDTTPSVNILFPAAAAVDTMFGFIQGDSAGLFVWNSMNQQGWPTVAFPTVGGYVIQTDTLTWINCDQPIFSNPWVQLYMNANDPPVEYSTDVFLFFPDNIMIHVYSAGPTSFGNYYTPCNSNLTVVAIGFKNGQLYSSFTPVQIGTTNQTISFSLTPTSEAALTQALEGLD